VRSRIRHLHGRIPRWRGSWHAHIWVEARRRLEDFIRSIPCCAADYEQGSTPRLVKLEEFCPTSVTET
jgi:hypothetical protein